MTFQIPERRGLANQVRWTVLLAPSFGEKSGGEGRNRPGRPIKAPSKFLISLGFQEPSLTFRGLPGNPFIVTFVVSGAPDDVAENPNLLKNVDRRDGRPPTEGGQLEKPHLQRCHRVSARSLQKLPIRS